MNPIKNLFQSLDVDFSAKVRWRMRYDRNPLFITLQDKYKVREYAASKGVKTANLLYVTDRPETIPFGELPQKYLIKATHGCGWNIICFNSKFYLFGHGKEMVNQDGSLLNMDSATKYELSKAEVIKKCEEWLALKYTRREWAYHQIIPKIIVEELLVSKDNKALRDYKLYTFQGVVKAIAVRSAIYRKNGENVIFDPDWKEIKLTTYRDRRPDVIPEKPAMLGEMIDIAQKLGEEVDFARIDLYNTTQGVILGEITLYPEAGMRASPTSCRVFNKWLGDQWKLGRIDIVNAFYWNIASKVRAYGVSIVRKHLRGI
ncbi:MAG: hypothetical protein B6I38_04855 [Anaerolineaceae bacterium 4572_5.1]|nr:MAG: hypothetical protein B6I38_04855 [Anaerolineaceae bacterium 4572_5.1]